VRRRGLRGASGVFRAQYAAGGRNLEMARQARFILRPGDELRSARLGNDVPYGQPRELLRGHELPCGVAHKDLDNPHTDRHSNRTAGCPHSHRRYD
jgi:hypothetical protein